MKTRLAAMQAASLGLLMSACGGGGGDGGDGAASAPLANAPPTASFTVTPSNGTAPLMVQLDASASTDSDGSIASYGWNFGDSSAAGAGMTTSHAFQATGTYVVTLTVTDNRGATSTMTRQVLISQPTGQTPTMSKIATIDNGDMTVCAVGVDGKAWCWGLNNYGQLGTGDTVQAFAPRISAEGQLFKKISVSTGGSFTCGITTAGAAYCWGNQEGGRLGDGTMAPVGSLTTVPAPVSGGRKYIDISAGGDHACAIAEGGAAYCWGHNERGQLGTGNATNSAVPVAASGGLNFASITTHQMVTCGITTDGAGYCWGNGSAGNLGSGSKTSSNVPVAIKGDLRFSFLELGLWTACGVTITGEGYCWGSNGTGELGIGSKSPGEALEPLKVAGSYTWMSMAPGVFVTCGVTVDGRGLCWGGNTTGERGDGPFPASDVTAPVPVVGDLAFDSIDADWCSCGVASNVAYCWGPGEEGCIGDGAKLDRGVPTRVAGQP